MVHVGVLFQFAYVFDAPPEMLDNYICCLDPDDPDYDTEDLHSDKRCRFGH